MILRVATLLQRSIKQLSLVLAGALLCLGLMQTAVQAAPLQGKSSTLDVDRTEAVATDSLSEKRAERRKAQSEASEAANTENEADSIGEVFADKLNLEEIVEDNALLGNDPTPDSKTPQARR